MYNVAVLVNTCDKYHDILDYFFYFYVKFWKNPYKVYLNTESKPYVNKALNLHVLLNEGGVKPGVKDLRKH